MFYFRLEFIFKLLKGAWSAFHVARFSGNSGLLTHEWQPHRFIDIYYLRNRNEMPHHLKIESKKVKDFLCILHLVLSPCTRSR